MATTTRRKLDAVEKLEYAMPWSDVLLRLAVGLPLIPHGAQKLFGWFGGAGPAGTAEMMAGMGFTPGMFFAIFLGIFEFFGGILLVLGVLTRPLALGVVIFMLFAIGVHWENGYFWINEGGGWEMPLLWALAAASLFIRGGGLNSVDGRAFHGRI